MASIDMRPACFLCALVVTGCASAPVEADKIKPPAGYLMMTPCKLPAIPSDEGNPAVRAAYYAQMRSCHGRTADQVTGLQRYVRRVRGS
jgi:hypothetical protein